VRVLPDERGVTTVGCKHFADRFAFVERSGRNVDQANDARGVLAWRSRATSSASAVRGNCGAVMLSPSCCNSLMTPFQLEPLAQALCTMTTFGSRSCRYFRFEVAGSRPVMAALCAGSSGHRELPAGLS